MTPTQALIVGWISGVTMTVGVIGLLYVLRPRTKGY